AFQERLKTRATTSRAGRHADSHGLFAMGRERAGVGNKDETGGYEALLSVGHAFGNDPSQLGRRLEAGQAQGPILRLFKKCPALRPNSLAPARSEFRMASDHQVLRMHHTKRVSFEALPHSSAEGCLVRKSGPRSLPRHG